MVVNALMKALDEMEQRGYEKGVKFMQKKILTACETGNPIEIEGKAYWIKSDLENLRDIFDDLEADK